MNESEKGPPVSHPLSTRDAARLIAVDDPFVSCDECFRLIDDFVDAIADAGPRGPVTVDGVDEALRIHLGHCGVCLDEAETLVTLAADDRDIDVEDLLERLRLVVAGPTRA